MIAGRYTYQCFLRPLIVHSVANELSIINFNLLLTSQNCIFCASSLSLLQFLLSHVLYILNMDWLFLVSHSWYLLNFMHTFYIIFILVCFSKYSVCYCTFMLNALFLFIFLHSSSSEIVTSHLYQYKLFYIHISIVCNNYQGKTIHDVP